MQLEVSDERPILAAMLLNGDGIPRVLAANVRSTSYSQVRHQLLHKSIVDCYIDLQRPVDAFDVASYMLDRDTLDQIGGVEFLAGILELAINLRGLQQILGRYKK